MSCTIIYDNNGNKIGVQENNELFQEILNNAQVKDFDSALNIFMETYSKEIEIPRVANIKNGFYSNAEQSLLNLKDKNPKNVKGWISQLTDTQKNGGIKNVNQELEWIGLEDYLNDYVKENNPKAGNIPSSVVEDYIKSNQIEIVDVSKKQFRRSNQEIDNILNKYKPEGTTPMRYYGSKEKYGYKIASTGEFIEVKDSNLISLMNELREDKFEEENTKYSGYQLKGGENYREVLLTMPSKKLDTPLEIPQLNLTKEDLTIITQNVIAEPNEVKAKFNYSKNTKEDVDKALSKLDEIIEEDYYSLYSISFVDKALSIRDSLGEGTEEYIKAIQIVQDNFVREEPSREEVVVLYNNRAVWNGDREDRTDDFIKDIVINREQEKVLREANLDKLKKDSSNQYKSSHWDEANILAHVRLNEKTLPDGRKVLIINEIQADISQDLKKEQDKILDRVDKEFDNFLDNLIMNKVIIEEC